MNSSAHHYHYIVLGAGCAGLSLLMHMIASGKFTDKKILLIDKESKNKNDRTWCFWEQEQGLFQSIVYKEWQQLRVYDAAVCKQLSIAPYTYKLIRGLDFYQYCFTILQQHPSITFIQAPVEKIQSTSQETYVQAGGKKFTADYIFNSIVSGIPQLKAHQYWLWQHFKGWLIQTDTPQFQSAVATLMDFRTDQSAGTTFFYVLPFSSRRALVEYTLFSPSILPDEAYEKELKAYVENRLGITGYTVEEKEWGKIPMTNFIFPHRQHRMLNIGTAGGQTKASSGYTFQFIQKQSAALVKSILETGQPLVPAPSQRFHFYDSVLLHILYYNKLPGHEIFTRLFLKNPPSLVLKFLDNETTLAEDLKLISSLPTGVFLQSALQQIFRKLAIEKVKRS